ncbi:unnamed protein product [Paramecium pentaurelia]|uniref:Uncharacterized protein n=1 Tax=Paramecium pentaurelia TaxID=43138 RepID=A0A8S1U9K5_9CILI|nr:unnamed protein product [Paramecium pentaurelia]
MNAQLIVLITILEDVFNLMKMLDVTIYYLYFNYMLKWMQHCNSICSDGIIVNFTERCDDDNYIKFDGCNFVNFNAMLIVLLMFYQVQYPEQCEDGNLTQYDGWFNCKLQCSTQFINCQFGICQQCDELNGCYNQIYQDIFLNLQSNGICQSVCRDNITVHEVEECDNNTHLTRLCNQCQYLCEQNCLESIKGLCSFRIDGYKLLSSIQNLFKFVIKELQLRIFIIFVRTIIIFNIMALLIILYFMSFTRMLGMQCNNEEWKLNEQQYKCEPIFGDGIIVQKIEVCDDLIYQNCYQCKYICQDSCLICHKGNCLKCQKGWQLDFQKKCYPKSGDSLVVGNEQCDDTNFQGADGCFYGQFDFPEDCEYCYKGLCLRCIQESKQLDQINNYCQSFCGDGYLSNDEQCDYATYIPYDVCPQCKFQCNDYCHICNYAESFQYFLGYELDTINNTCQSICGDGIVAHDEQYDYGDLQLEEECFNFKFVLMVNVFNAIPQVGIKSN